MSNNHGIIKFRRGTASEWANSLPQPGGEVLKLGEPGFEKDTYKLKIGDGITPWNDLPYIAGGIGGNNGPLTYTYETDFFVNGGDQITLTSDLTSIPEWLSTYEAATGFTQDGSLPGNAFGFDSNGLWFTGDAQPDDQSYPVRTNFNIPSEATTTVIFTVNHNDDCADQGICFYRNGDAPEWAWGPNSSRIAIQVDCPQPLIAGLSGQIPADSESGGSQSLGSPGFYTFEITYNPSASSVTLNVYSGQDTSGTLLETLSLNERLPEGDYRIGFVSDQDDGETKSYFSNLSISYGNPISQLTINKVSNGVDFSEFFQQLTDSDQKSSIRISDVNNSSEFIVVDASVPVASGTDFVFDVTQQVNGGLELVSGSQYYINIDIIGSTTADNINPNSSIKVCSLELTGNAYYAGDPVTVYQINSNEENKVYDAIDTDIILTRGTPSSDGGGGLYNSALQEDYSDNGDSGPAGTEWNADGWDDLSDITSRSYNSLYNVLNGNIGKEITNAELVMHDTINDKYYKFDFSYWQPGAGQNVGPEYPIGGFKYTRTLLWVEQSPVTFTRPQNDPDTVDPIDTGLTIKRGNGGGIYNSESESGWDVSMSPEGTLWNIEGWDNLSNVANREYVPFYAATGGQLGNMVTTRQYVMKDTINDKYYKIEFSDWGGSNGSFEYTRTLINGHCQGNIQFGDGTLQNTAFNETTVTNIATEVVNDALNTSLVAGSGIQLNYDSGTNTLTIQASGLALSNHNHVATDITDFNTAVSGLLPVKDIIAGSGISVSPSSGNYTVSCTLTSVAESNSLVTNVFNKTGSPIPKFSVVYINGGQGDQPTIGLAQADVELTSSKTYGITAENIANMSAGKVIVFGALTGVDTDQFNPTAPTGDVNGTILYLSPTVAGGVTTTKPSAPNHMVSVGTIVRTHQNQGVVEVRVQNGFELQELHNVAISGVLNNQILVYSSGNSLWQNSTIDSILPTVANSGDNRVLTSTGTSTGINAEGNMTFNGSSLIVTGNAKFTQVHPTVSSLGNVSGSVTSDISTGQIFDLILTGAATLSNPTNPVDGVTVRWRIVQDGTGGHSVTLDTKFNIPSSATTPLAWSTAPNAMDILAATYHAGRDKWDIVAFVPGY